MSIKWKSQKVTVNKQNLPFIDNLKEPACASKMRQVSTRDFMVF